MQIEKQLEISWYDHLKEEFQKPYFQKIEKTLEYDIKNRITLYPPIENIFYAFEKTPFDNVKVVIL